jgi:hypothetical protein
MAQPIDLENLPWKNITSQLGCFQSGFFSCVLFVAQYYIQFRNTDKASLLAFELLGIHLHLQRLSNGRSVLRRLFGMALIDTTENKTIESWWDGVVKKDENFGFGNLEQIQLSEAIVNSFWRAEPKRISTLQQAIDLIELS